MPEILVNRESATRDSLNLISIDATHSDMVKFAKNSPYLNVVLGTLSHILSSSENKFSVEDSLGNRYSHSGIASTLPKKAIQDTLRDRLESRWCTMS